ncbi:odorant receptor 4-like [Microplitis demolitor]|uniref:odorant receptor 4-like n=1 Tax=Microplitis demolitor TaxID=69319 RepID=UPI0006D4F8F3|nr:odorant receptor 4-like [Microplitis demolitor]
MFKIKITSYFIFREIIKGPLLALGLWPDENPSLFYRLLSYIQLPLNFGMFLAIFNFVRLHVNNITLLTKSFGVMTTYLSTTLKITCLLINRREALELHRTLDPHFSKLAQDVEMKKIIFKKFTMLKLITWLFFSCVFITLSAMIITPLIDIAMQYHKYGKNNKYPLIYPSKYPWQTSMNGWPYKVTYLFESLATMSLFCITSSVDSLFLFYIFQIIGQLREMSYSITNTNGFNDDNEKDIVLRKTIYQYQTLIKCREIIEKIYGPIILWIMCTNAVIMCVFIFQFMQMKNLPIIRLMIIFTYVLSKVLQTFIYAWSGTCLTVESEDYRKAVYNMNWYGNKRIMTSVIIMLAQKPMIVTACNFSTVTVDIFIMVLKTTVSYFFLLQTLEEK